MTSLLTLLELGFDKLNIFGILACDIVLWLGKQKISVVNLFELSKNFHNRGPDWLIERYIQQQHPLSSANYPQTPAPTTSIQQHTSAHRSPPAMGHGSQMTPESAPLDQGSHSDHVSVAEQEAEA